jgi:hypothetical protein
MLDNPGMSDCIGRISGRHSRDLYQWQFIGRKVNNGLLRPRGMCTGGIEVRPAARTRKPRPGSPVTPPSGAVARRVESASLVCPPRAPPLTGMSLEPCGGRARAA